MDKQAFINRFSESLDTTDVLTEDTIFRNISEWDSVAYLDVILMLDEEYDIQIENQEFSHLATIGDIISYIEKHKQ